MLSLLGWIYGKVADIRNRLYERGIFEIHDLGARTISIGNITAGGTGKTPLVAYVAALLAERGETVCILTRGYGRANPAKRILVSDGQRVVASPHDSGDEPFELAQKLLGKAIVVADRDRVAAAEWAKREFGVTAFVLDDGFQHRKAKRDVDIVCIDATDPFGDGKMLPAGRLREPLLNLKRADAFVITRTDLVADISDLKFEISNLSPNAGLFTALNKVERIVALNDTFAKITSEILENRNAFAFCGIGNPESFFEQLRRQGIALTGTHAFRDHHKFDQQDIAAIEGLARQSGADALLTTAKDAVKLSNLKFKIACYVVAIDLEINDAAEFARLI